MTHKHWSSSPLLRLPGLEHLGEIVQALLNRLPPRQVVRRADILLAGCQFLEVHVTQVRVLVNQLQYCLLD